MNKLLVWFEDNFGDESWPNGDEWVSYLLLPEYLEARREVRMRPFWLVVSFLCGVVSTVIVCNA